MWPTVEMAPMVPPNGVMTQDQLNGNICGQFALPLPFITHHKMNNQLVNIMSTMEKDQIRLTITTPTFPASLKGHLYVNGSLPRNPQLRPQTKVRQCLQGTNL